jgi:hypothetical protein
VVLSLAEGVDRMTVACADEVFGPPLPPSRNEASAAAGRMVLDRSDVLLAVWDGHGVQGTGGTGELVALAHGRGMPLAWVHAGHRMLGTDKATALGEEQGTVSLERFSTARS